MILNTKALTRKVRKKQTKFTDNQIIVLIIAAIGAIMLSALVDFSWFILIGFGLIIYFSYRVELSSYDARWYRYEQFSKKNNFKIQYGLPTEFLPPLTGTLVSDQRYNFHIRGTVLDAEFILFMGNFNKLPGRSAPQVQWVFYTELMSNLPSFVVDAKYNHIIIPKKFKEFQTLNLEGDFTNYFTVYIPKGSQVDVLSVLSPDVMEALKAFRHNTDVIIAGKKIWLLGNVTARKDVDLQQLFNSAEVILLELNHRARSYRTSHQ